MRFFPLKSVSLNWKKIAGEILLIFISINLAIWFNNWNTERRSNHAKSVALVKIKEEISNNLAEVETVHQNVTFILEAYADYNRVFQGQTNQVLATPSRMNRLQQQYPGFFVVRDSVLASDGQFRYTGGTFINLELGELSEIAWETTRSIDILNEFNYECLYDLEKMYNLQRRTQKEIDKAANALQRAQLRELQSILRFLKQLAEQLQKDYTEMIGGIDDCS